MLVLMNTGGIAAMTAGFAGEGTFTSPVLDATQVSRFGKVRLHGTLPAKTTLKVSTRSGNVSEPRDTAWSKWSDPRPAAEPVRSNRHHSAALAGPHPRSLSRGDFAPRSGRGRSASSELRH